MGFADDWKTAKRKFETATGKKKPSEKLAGFFKKGTGVAAALKKVDKADAKSAKKAMNEFATKKSAYVKKLKEAWVASGDKADYKRAVDDLIYALEDLEARVADHCQTMT